MVHRQRDRNRNERGRLRIEIGRVWKGRPETQKVNPKTLDG